MTSASMTNGKAFEYACITALENVVVSFRPVVIINNSSLVVAKRCWELLSVEEQGRLTSSANAGIKALLTMEPRIIEDGEDQLELALQEDARGIEGDVRDILIVRRPIDWEIGISVKHNHFALKHSRLSERLDFGSKWYGIACSDEYFSTIRPIFDELKLLKSRGVLWNKVKDKDTLYYVPILNAFVEELMSKYASHGSLIVERITQYLLGSNDYYKLISNPARMSTRLISFNLYGTLSQPSSALSPEVVAPLVELPSRIFNLALKPNSTNTVELNMDNGWEISLRIHNASSKVESSLKFDIQIVGMPTTLLVIDTPWV